MRQRQQKLLLGERSCNFRSQRRSIRRGEAVTSIRLENAFWEILSDFAKFHQMSRNELIWRLRDEVNEIDGTAKNVASLLRVACLHHLLATATNGAALQIERSLSADSVLGVAANALNQRG